MENNAAADLAEKIVKMIASETSSGDLDSIHAGLAHINKRLEKLESPSAKPQTLSSTSKPDHPSMDRFAIAEAIVDELFERESKEKACTFEPNGKPCDHCSMCNSRGF